jgi:hypothetical protein
MPARSSTKTSESMSLTVSKPLTRSAKRNANSLVESEEEVLPMKLDGHDSDYVDEDDRKPAAKIKGKQVNVTELCDEDTEEEEFETDLNATKKCVPTKKSPPVAMKPVEANISYSSDEDSPQVPAETSRISHYKKTPPVTNGESPGTHSLGVNDSKNQRRLEAARGITRKTSQHSSPDEINALRERNRDLVEKSNEANALLEQREEENEQLRGELEKYQRQLQMAYAHSAKAGNGQDEDPDPIIVKEIRKVVKRLFRVVKFVNSEERQLTFGNMVLDALGYDEITYDAMWQPTDKEYRQCHENRSFYFQVYQKHWMKTLNEHRSYVQVGSKLLAQSAF